MHACRISISAYGKSALRSPMPPTTKTPMIMCRRSTKGRQVRPMPKSGTRFALTLLLALSGAAGAADAPNIPLNDLQIRAEAGDRTATRQLAEAYYLGKGVEQDFKIASQWYEKLAKQGDVRAQTSLGLMFARGYGVEKNIELALKWWKLAAIQNDPGAQFNLGTLYLEGKSVGQNLPEAAKWYLQAAMRGHLPAQSNLGLMYWEGRGVEKDRIVPEEEEGGLRN
ncbi:MAG: sel1 repeat family protein [Betaproteobacteria bacterium]|nr:sel1 repeat family protein [Betaproteobacteria bacterium]